MLALGSVSRLSKKWIDFVRQRMSFRKRRVPRSANRSVLVWQNPRWTSEPDSGITAPTRSFLTKHWITLENGGSGQLDTLVEYGWQFPKGCGTYGMQSEKILTIQTLLPRRLLTHTGRTQSISILVSFYAHSSPVAPQTRPRRQQDHPRQFVHDVVAAQCSCPYGC